MIIERLRRLWHFSQRNREPYKTKWQINEVLRKKPHLVPGSILIGNHNIEYLDAHALASMWELQFFKRYNDFYTLNPTPRILDCGSNIGVSVLRYKELFPDAHITAFEPDPNIYAVLLRNISANALKNVDVVQAAVWSKVTELTFLPDRISDTQGGRLNINSGDKPQPEQIVVKTIWLGDYLQTPVDFLKLDIEGAELDTLKSVQHLLKNVRQMMVEVHYQVEHPEVLTQILAILKDVGFKIALYQYFQDPAPFVPYVHAANVKWDQFPVLWAWKE